MRHKLILGHRIGYNVRYTDDSDDEEKEKHCKPRRRSSSCAVSVLFDPTGTYSHGMFSWPEFKYTYHFGYWPDGALFEIRSRGRSGNNGILASGKKSRQVQMRNGYAVDVKTGKGMVLTPTLAYKWIDLPAQIACLTESATV